MSRVSAAASTPVPSPTRWTAELARRLRTDPHRHRLGCETCCLPSCVDANGLLDEAIDAHYLLAGLVDEIVGLAFERALTPHEERWLKALAPETHALLTNHGSPLSDPPDERH